MSTRDNDIPFGESIPMQDDDENRDLSDHLLSGLPNSFGTSASDSNSSSNGLNFPVAGQPGHWQQHIPAYPFPMQEQSAGQHQSMAAAMAGNFSSSLTPPLPSQSTSLVMQSPPMGSFSSLPAQSATFPMHLGLHSGPSMHSQLPLPMPIPVPMHMLQPNQLSQPALLPPMPMPLPPQPMQMQADYVDQNDLEEEGEEGEENSEANDSDVEQMDTNPGNANPAISGGKRGIDASKNEMDPSLEQKQLAEATANNEKAKKPPARPLRPVKFEVSEDEIASRAIREEDQEYPTTLYLPNHEAEKIKEQLEKGQYKEALLIMTSLMKDMKEQKSDEAAELARNVGQNRRIKKIVFRSSNAMPKYATSPIVPLVVFKELAKSPLAKTLQSFVCQSTVECHPTWFSPLLEIGLRNQNLTEVRIKADQKCLGMLANFLPGSKVSQLELHIMQDKYHQRAVMTRNALRQGPEPRQVERLMDVVGENKNLRELVFSNCFFEEGDMEAVGDMLMKNNSLRILKFFNNELESSDLEILFNAMAINGDDGNGVQVLEIANDRRGLRYTIKPAEYDPEPIGNRPHGYTTLEHVRTRMQKKHLSQEGVQAFSNMLKSNKSLRCLRMQNISGFNEGMFDGLSDNTTLATLDLRGINHSRHVERQDPPILKHSLKCLHMPTHSLSRETFKKWVVGKDTLQVVNIKLEELSSEEDLEMLSQVLRSPTCRIASLRIEVDGNYIPLLKTIFSVLPVNQSLMSLTIVGSPRPEAIALAKKFFEENNHQLRSLCFDMRSENERRWLRPREEEAKVLLENHCALLEALHNDNRIEELAILYDIHKGHHDSLHEQFEALEVAVKDLLRNTTALFNFGNLDCFPNAKNLYALIKTFKPLNKLRHIALLSFSDKEKKLKSEGRIRPVGIKNFLFNKLGEGNTDIKKLIMQFAAFGLSAKRKVEFGEPLYALDQEKPKGKKVQGESKACVEDAKLRGESKSQKEDSKRRGESKAEKDAPEGSARDVRARNRAASVSQSSSNKASNASNNPSQRSFSNSNAKAASASSSNDKTVSASKESKQQQDLLMFSGAGNSNAGNSHSNSNSKSGSSAASGMGSATPEKQPGDNDRGTEQAKKRKRSDSPVLLQSAQGMSLAGNSVSNNSASSDSGPNSKRSKTTAQAEEVGVGSGHLTNWSKLFNNF